MGKKSLKVVSISEAVKELKNTLMMQSELKKQEEIKPLIGSLGNFEIRKDVMRVHPLDFIDRTGLWIKSDSNEQFYYGVDLVKIFIDLLNSNPPGIIAEVYSKIEKVSAKVAKEPKTDRTVILIESEMEKFECIQCGHCCLDLIYQVPLRHLFLTLMYSVGNGKTDMTFWNGWFRFKPLFVFLDGVMFNSFFVYFD